jgi:DNA-directed RNA polymerase beta subunit
MERDCLIGHGASMVLRDRLLGESDAAIQYICNRCGHIAQIDQRGASHCRVCGDGDEVYPVEMSYAFKLLVEELKSLGVVARIRLRDVA